MVVRPHRQALRPDSRERYALLDCKATGVGEVPYDVGESPAGAGRRCRSWCRASWPATRLPLVPPAIHAVQHERAGRAGSGGDQRDRLYRWSSPSEAASGYGHLTWSRPHERAGRVKRWSGPRPALPPASPDRSWSGASQRLRHLTRSRPQASARIAASISASLPWCFRSTLAER